MSIKASTKVHGPYECLTLNELGEGTPLLDLPYSEVEGSQLALQLTDNASTAFSASVDPQFWIIIEVGVWGSLQGLPTLLKRVAMSPRTGPVSYLFQFAEAYDQVTIRARNMSGGRRGPGPAGVATVAAGFSATLTVTVQPRSGFRNVGGA